MNQSFKNTKVVYLGFNNMLKHKRGVENVIDFQSKASVSAINYYIHWDDTTSVYKYKGLLCIGIKSNFLKFFVFNWLMIRIKRREKSIFIHSHNTLMSMFGILQTHLFTVHDALYYQHKAIKHTLKNIFYVLELYLYMRVNDVHFISKYSKKMSLFSGNENFVIIPNTSHLESAKMMGNSKKNLSLKPEFKPGAIKIFTVRSMEERARIDLLIELAQQLKHTDFEFFIAGKGPLYDFYKNQIESLSLKNIRLLGYVSDADLMEYYSKCDIVLIPAAYAEGFGLPIIEGYLFNKPVIASNRCAIPEVIISKEFLFENTVDSIIEKLNFAKLKLNGPYRAFYDNTFSNAHILSQLNAFYKNRM
ncbi:glycosyltransferase family 4 protein [Polaribacter litorisediminis]|uniref:glycosyltransferase family 4 protein n=1 Tax=Polaribacter litorisediminis TaxID=1908341 RepID=UPI001CC1B117|nr:glycosyltransferase family 4 protein [Polaribacter litorisediminis]UAM97194.1 glycosyltransferase family 4 protein [Polaribacter litorisediminis]